jgi:hypothetical protein
VWIANFLYGYSSYHFADSYYRVRLVRDVMP